MPVARQTVDAAEIFRALGDPVRLDIVRQIAAEDQLACSVLEETLPVSKPTISYHAKILRQAGIIDVHKRGRLSYYSLRREALGELLDDLGALGPDPGPAGGASRYRRSGRLRSGGTARPGPVSDGSDARPAPMITW
ncbi:hypothetical protein GCM10010182_77120 [Actinomadura cremea]|nr:hypothetical protein GCM10010182_77120 [Actinomadura cremea]